MLKFRKAGPDEQRRHDLGANGGSPHAAEVIAGDHILLEIEDTREILRAEVLEVTAQVDHEYLKHVYYVCRALALSGGDGVRLEAVKAELGEGFQVQSIYRVSHLRPDRTE
jgi:hypothetical protein